MLSCFAYLLYKLESSNGETTLPMEKRELRIRNLGPMSTDFYACLLCLLAYLLDSSACLLSFAFLLEAGASLACRIARLVCPRRLCSHGGKATLPKTFLGTIRDFRARISLACSSARALGTCARPACRCARSLTALVSRAKSEQA